MKTEQKNRVTAWTSGTPYFIYDDEIGDNTDDTLNYVARLIWRAASDNNFKDSIVVSCGWITTQASLIQRFAHLAYTSSDKCDTLIAVSGHRISLTWLKR